MKGLSRLSVMKPAWLKEDAFSPSWPENITQHS